MSLDLGQWLAPVDRSPPSPARRGLGSNLTPMEFADRAPSNAGLWRFVACKTVADRIVSLLDDKRTRQLARPTGTCSARPPSLQSTPTRDLLNPGPLEYKTPVKGISDADVLRLGGSLLRSEESGRTYELGQVLGEGAHGVVFRARETSDQSVLPLVIKVFRPRAIRHLASTGQRAVAKEIAALRRLSAAQHPSPYVVRLLDAGYVPAEEGGLLLPWIALEHVDGGAEGTTLRERVLRCIANHGAAFDLNRVLRLVQCIGEGLTEVHALGIVHRDLNPNNIFVSGSGETETFKLGDFGLARVTSVETYGAVLMGTPGYCAPEQSFPDRLGVGPYSDVFSLACCLFFALTGEQYFGAGTIPEMLLAVNAPERRGLNAGLALHSSLHDDTEILRVLEIVMGECTSADPSSRPSLDRSLQRLCSLL